MIDRRQTDKYTQIIYDEGMAVDSGEDKKLMVLASTASAVLAEWLNQEINVRLSTFSLNRCFSLI